MSGANASSSQVRVVVRVRPLLAHETASAAQTAAAARRCVQVTQSADGAPAVLLRDDVGESLSVRESGGAAGSSSSETLFTFDGVYEPSASNSQLFDAEVGPHLPRLFAGSSVTLFAFGMTGTGKSHSMQGSASDGGLIPRTIAALFDSISDRVACAEQEWESTSVTFSFFELYNEKIYDLLKPYMPPAAKTDRSSSDSAASRDPTLAGDLAVREDANGKVFVANLSETRLDSLQSFEKAYAKGISNRRVAATKLNAVSSRSHSCALVRLEFRSKKAPFKKISSRIQMLDLAGNEDNRASGNTGSKSRMVESSKINNSLFVLGKVINALNAGESRIPYRDSKLTRLLQDSLGGSNYAIMLCAISPNPLHQAWTARTLQFASKSRQIVNVVATNVQDVLPAPPTLNQLEEEKKADLKARLSEWKRDQGRGGAAAATGSFGGAAAAAAAAGGAHKAKRVGSASATGARGTVFPVPQLSGDGAGVDLTALSALIAAQKGLDPAVMQKLNSLANDVHSMKQQMVLQHKQQQQQAQQQQQQAQAAQARSQLQLHQRPASAHTGGSALHSAAAASHSSATAAPSSTQTVPLTPMSSASLARISVEKARVWERAGALTQALSEYIEAGRMRPGNEKLALKIQQLQAKIARQGSVAASAPAAAATAAAASTAGQKHARDAPVLPRAKARRIDAACIREESEEEEEEEVDEEAEEEEEEESADESESEEENMTDVSAYDPDEEEGGVEQLWRGSGSSRARRARSNPASAETSPAGTSLMQRVAAAAAAQAQAHATPPAAKAATAKTVATHGQRPSTAPVLPATTAAPGVRTPLATLSNRPALAQGGKKLATPPSGSSAAVVARVSPKLGVGSSSATSPTLSSKNKENAAHAHVHPNIKPAAATTLKADGVVKSKAPSKAAAVVAAAPIPAPLPTTAAVAPIAAAPSGGLLSNLVSGRDTLLRTLNGGSVKELMELQTIGKKRAQLIVAKRDEMGPYVTLGDLCHIGLSEVQVARFTQLNLMPAQAQPMAIAADMDD